MVRGMGGSGSYLPTAPVVDRPTDRQTMMEYGSMLLFCHEVKAFTFSQIEGVE